LPCILTVVVMCAEYMILRRVNTIFYYYCTLLRGIKYDCFYRRFIFFQSRPKHCAATYTHRRRDISNFEVLDDFLNPRVLQYFFLSEIFSRSTRPLKVPGHGAIMVIFDRKKCICIYDGRVKLLVPSGAMAAH